MLEILLPIGKDINNIPRWENRLVILKCSVFKLPDRHRLCLVISWKIPHTVATAIKIGNPASWKYAEEARDSSGGLIDMITDEDILSAYCLLAGKEGVFVEPASAASIAGVIKLVQQGYFPAQDGNIVCTVTGHGLKDPDNAIKQSAPITVVPAQMDAILKQIGY